jgi:hypothetical protein
MIVWENRGATVQIWSEDNFRYSLRYIQQDRDGNALIRINDLGQTQGFYIGRSSVCK